MATTSVGTDLTERHRKGQLRVRSGFLREFLRLWPLMNSEDLDEGAANWVSLVVDLILQFRHRSVVQALDYYERLRVHEIGEPLPRRETYVNLGTPNLNAVRTSLLVTGPIGIKQRLARGIPIQRAKTLALTDASGAASRHVLNGGRQLLVEATHKDPLATHYARVTDDDPCAFCALLSSRGAVYVTEKTAALTTARSTKRGPGAQYHDHCGCTVEPSWDRDATLPPRAAEFAQLYADSTKGKGGKAALKAFRDAYNAERRAKTSD